MPRNSGWFPANSGGSLWSRKTGRGSRRRFRVRCRHGLPLNSHSVSSFPAKSGAGCILAVTSAGEEAEKAVRMHGASIDFTARKQAEEALLASEEQLREANAALERRVNERTADLQQTATQLRSLTGQLARAEQMERRRIANILHDHVQQIWSPPGSASKRFETRLRAKPIDKPLNDVVGMLNDAVEAARTSVRRAGSSTVA